MLDGVFRNKKALVGALLVGLVLISALIGPLLVPYAPSELVSVPLQPPSLAHPFGTTGQGQDVLAQTLAGARLSLLVGFVTGLSVIAIGAVIGMTAAYFGGWVDEALSLFTNVFLIMPGLPLAVVIAAYLPRGPATVGTVLVITGWAWNARVLRAQTLSLRQKDFVSAAIVSGEGAPRIIFREILPNMASLMVSGFIGATIYAIGAQVGLEFLGLGDVGVVTWGTNLYWATNDAALLTGSWWTFVPTGLAVAIVGTGLALLNFAIDEVTNPRLRATSGWTALLRRHGVEPSAATPVFRPRASEAPVEPQGNGAIARDSRRAHAKPPALENSASSDQQGV